MALQLEANHWKQGDQIILFKKSPKMLHNGFFVMVNTQHFPWKKVSQNLVLLLNKLTKRNNGPIAENSPNLVTLFGRRGYIQKRAFPNLDVGISKLWLSLVFD
jgi:hypothetical protein